jgi:hypothetical protein
MQPERAAQADLPVVLKPTIAILDFDEQRR